jgi:uncharacterized protein YndB with AHSA1/START domain
VDQQVERTLDVAVGAAAAWASIADPARLGDWLAGRVDGDLEPGAPVGFRLDDGEARRGVVREVQAGRLLSFCWWPVGAPAAATTVTIAVEPVSVARCRVHVTETRVPRLRAAA